MNIDTFWAPGDRYAFDFTTCSSGKGWAQVDTDQDASYYGTWAHPDRFMIVQFCEGDVTIWSCETREKFQEQLVELNDFEVRSGRNPLRIDPGLRDERIQAWKEGHPELAIFLH